MRILMAVIAGLLSVSMLTACSSESDERPVGNAPTTPSDDPKPPSSVEPEPAPTDDAPDIEIYPNKPTSTDLSCIDAVAAAAAVPGAEDNNDEVFVTLIACDSVEEWGAAIVANPGVFAVSSVAPSEIDFYTMIVCSGAEETPVCTDAVVRGTL
ncbi:hypothetical protein [Microbacterium aurugineum]